MIATAQKHRRTSLEQIRQALRDQGWILLRGEHYSSRDFNELMHALCPRLTYDPARNYASDNAGEDIQKVEAGTGPIGLHIENGNTPLPPDIVAFHSVRSARTGAQTTLCDGAAVLENMPEELARQFSQPMTVTRYLPRELWQRYVASALGIDNSESVSLSDLDKFLKSIPGQRAEPTSDGGINYELTFPPIRRDNLAGRPAFANAILGPSYNYEPPVYRFADGKELDRFTLQALDALCEHFTTEVQWQDGDVAVLDNKRFMHGRRAIPVPLEQRQLHIGMGLGLNNQ